jgi:hypothetical protein
MGIGIGNKVSVLGGNAFKTIVYMETKLSGKNAVNIYPYYPISLSPYLPPKKGYLIVMDFF